MKEVVHVMGTKEQDSAPAAASSAGEFCAVVGVSLFWVAA